MRTVFLVSFFVLAIAGARTVNACDNHPTKSASNEVAQAVDNDAAKSGAPKAFDSPPKVGAKATCPVMGSEFTVKENSPRSEYKGKHYVFCCPGCKPKFDADPEKYTAK